MSEIEFRTTIETDEGETLIDIVYEAEYRRPISIFSVNFYCDSDKTGISPDEWEAIQREAESHYNALCEKAQADEESYYESKAEWLRERSRT